MIQVKCVECGKKTFTFSFDEDDSSTHTIKFTCPNCEKITVIWVSECGSDVKVELSKNLYE